MIGAVTSSRPRGTALVITVFAVVLLAAMAASIPAAPIRVSETGALRGFMVGHSRFSDRMAEQVARKGYSFLAVDFTTARADDEALWKEHLEIVARRRFPVWGWLDLSRAAAKGAYLSRALKLAGVLVYGPDAVGEAEALRRGSPGLSVIPVVRWKDPRPDESSAHAVAMDLETFLAHANEVSLPVLIADRLNPAQIEEARAKVEGNYLIASVAILDFD